MRQRSKGTSRNNRNDNLIDILPDGRVVPSRFLNRQRLTMIPEDDGGIFLGVAGPGGRILKPRNVDERPMDYVGGKFVHLNVQPLPTQSRNGGFENTGIIVLFALLLAILVDLALGSPFLKSIGVMKSGGFFAPVSPFVSSMSSISSNAVLPLL